MHKSPFLINVDLAGQGPPAWTDAVSSHAVRARKLVRAFNRQAVRDIAAVTGKKFAGPAWNSAKAAASLLHLAYARQFGGDIAALAAGLGVPEGDILAANLAYDLGHVGCTTLSVPTRRGPLLARNLDWPFPRNLLRENTMVARVDGPLGPYATVGFPGLFGVLTAVAPGRFAVAVNYVLHEDESCSAGIAGRAATGFWPVTWVVRATLDEARTFAAAVRYLREAPLLTPALFTVVGLRNEERVVIERSASTSALRRSGGALITTNHYLSTSLAKANVDLEAEMDTLQRYTAVRHGLSTAPCGDSARALAVLSQSDLVSENTCHQVALNARTGQLLVKIPVRRVLQVKA